MAHRAAKRPHVSVLLAVRDADDVVARSIESVINQGFRDFEIIVADCASSDHTLRTIEHIAEHDIRVEVLKLASDDLGAGLDAALDKARGTYVLVMGQGDWLAPDYLDRMADVADRNEAQFAASSLSVDVMHPDGGRSSALLGPASQTWSSADEVHRGLAALLASDALSSVAGKLFLASRLRSLELRFSKLRDALEFELAYLDGATRACVEQGPCYHLVAPSISLQLSTAFDSRMFGRCERRHALLMSLYEKWGLADDPICMQAVHRLHLQEVIRCIENACLSGGNVSSIERRQRVQDMIDAPSTRASIDALRTSSRDFGLMFGPIARRSAGACFMGARLQDIISRALAPIAPVRPSLPIYA